MNGFFDLTTLIIIGVCVVVFFRLFSVLGTRNGNEKPPFDPYSSKEKERSEEDNDNVVSMPGRAEEPVVNPTLQEDGDVVTKTVDKIAADGSKLNTALKEIIALDPSFHPEEFLGGAKSAYELIVTAYAGGDRKMLDQLLSKVVYDGFIAAISDREQRKETVDFSFVGINKAEIVDAQLRDNSIQVEVQFKSEIIQAVMDSEGRVVDGDPNAIEEVTDIWTFERDARSKDPNWKLVATETPE